MTAKDGDFVSVDYEGRLEDGTIFDSSHRHEGHVHLLEFFIGKKQVIPGFEKAIIGMKEGEEKEIKINSKDAYGIRDERLVQKVPRNALPPEQEPKVGMMLIINGPNGEEFPVKITSVEKETISVDLNHPLAGKDLIFKIKLIGINQPPTENHHHNH